RRVATSRSPPQKRSAGPPPPNRSRRAAGSVSRGFAATLSDKSLQPFRKCCSPRLSFTLIPRFFVRQFAHRPHLDASYTSRRNFCRNADRFVQIFRLDQHETAKLLLGLCERPIGGRQFVLAHPQCRGCLPRLQRLRSQKVPAFTHLLVVGQRIRIQLFEFVVRQRRQFRFFRIDNTQVLHCVPPQT